MPPRLAGSEIGSAPPHWAGKCSSPGRPLHQTPPLMAASTAAALTHGDIHVPENAALSSARGSADLQ